MGILTDSLRASAGSSWWSPSGAADDGWYMSRWALKETAAGVPIDDEAAWRSVSVWSCIRILAETIAALPLALYARQSGGGKAKAFRHPVYRALHEAPNSEQTPMQWREMAVAHVATTGNHYSEIVETNGGAIELWPWNPRRVEVTRDSLGLLYTLQGLDGKTYPRRADRVLHVAGLAWNGLIGLSPIEYARQTIALSLAEEEYTARFYGNGASPGLVVEIPAGIHKNADEARRAREDLEVQYSGLSKSHRLMLLQDGMKATAPPLVTPEQQQFLDGRKFTKAQIASLYRIPLHLIQEHEKSTAWGTGIEQFNHQFVIHTLMPWLVRFEQAFNARLLAPDERGPLFVKFSIEGLLRGDTAARAAWYKAMRELGCFSADDILELEDRNPLPNGLGKTYWQPAANFTPAGSVGDKGATKAALVDAQRPVLVEVLGKASKRERRDVLTEIDKRHSSTEIQQVYDRLGDLLAEDLRAPLRALAATVARVTGDLVDTDRVMGAARASMRERTAAVVRILDDLGDVPVSERLAAVESGINTWSAPDDLINTILEAA